MAVGKKWFWAGVLGLSIFALHTAKSSASFKNDFLSRINKVRATGCKCGTTYLPPAPPLTWNKQLEQAAGGHANDMARKKYFSHASRNGKQIQDRIMAAGYTYKGFQSYAIGENIAFGQQSIDEVQTGWFLSEKHCRNLMNPDFKEVGVARAGDYWVQDFGGRKEFTKAQQQMIKNGARIMPKRG